MIAGEIGSGALGYTAIGEQVGLAQRMESAARPGGVMLSASTARLVDGTASLGEIERVHIKGADHPVEAQRLLSRARRASRRRACCVEYLLAGAGRWPQPDSSSNVSSTGAAR